MSVATAPSVRKGPLLIAPLERTVDPATEADPPLGTGSPVIEQRFALNSIDWQSYRAISHALTGRHLRITYDRGRLELMTISSLHGTLCRLVYTIISVLTEEFQLPKRGCGDMTCDRESLERGIEPDECFYIENEAKVRGKDNLDMSVDPPPDLAVEIDISRDSRRRLSIYAALGVPEVWRFDGTALTVYVRQTNGEYEAVAVSPHFPPIPLAEIEATLKRRHEMDDNALMKLFRARVHELIDTTRDH